MNPMNAYLRQTAVEASAPCRIDMGGTLDLSTFYLPLRHLNPCTFNAALNLRTRVVLESHGQGRIKISSRGFDSFETDALRAPFNHPLGLMLAVAAFFNADGVHIRIESASPVRSALGGSSAAAVALVWAFSKALAAYENQPMPSPATVARVAHAIEQSTAGVPCGSQDQLAAAFGGVNAWYWTGDPDQAPFKQRSLSATVAGHDLSDCLLIAYCGAPHESRDINGTWVRDFIAGRYRFEWHEIVRLSHCFVEALVAGDLAQAQAAMNSETDLRCRMTPDVLDDIGQPLVCCAREGGCAARFSGAGGGGCVWALGHPEAIERLRPHWREILSRRPQGQLLAARIDSAGIL